jgi:hypothetical protein
MLASTSSSQPPERPAVWRCGEAWLTNPNVLLDQPG